MRSWFAFDDWDFLAARTVGDLKGLLEPHGDHWSTVPIFAYRALWQVFGLRFAPYLVAAIALRLVGAALLRAVMRRAGASPWIATATAGLYAALAVSVEGTANLFALGFGGWAVVFGLTHLLLADHDGPVDRRDALALLAGFGALASSALGVPMVAAVGVATALRRGLKVAAFHTVPLGVVFVLWYVGFAPPAPGASTNGGVGFVVRGLWGTAMEVGRRAPVAVLLVAVVIVGMAVAWRQVPADRRRAALSLPCGLGAAALVFLAITGFGRVLGESVFGDLSRVPHYSDAVALMLFPALAVGATALSRATSWSVALACLAFVALIPGNLVALDDSTESMPGERREQDILSLPRAPLAREAPRSLVPEPVLAAPVTIGWLVDALDDGRVPLPSTAPPASALVLFDVRLSISQTDGMLDTTSCTTGTEPVEVELEEGEHVSIGRRSHALVSVLIGDDWTQPVTYGQPFAWWFEPRRGQTLTAVRGPLLVRILPLGANELRLCT